MTKILDRIFRSSIIKLLVIHAFIILIFWVIKAWLNKMIVVYLTVEATSFDNVTFWITSLLTLIGVLFIFYKLVLKLYSPSSSLINLMCSIAIIYSFLRFASFRNGWYFIKFGDTSIKYADLIGILIGCFFIGLIGGELWKRHILSKTNYDFNPFIADDPVINIADDQLGYGERAKSILEFLEKSNFKKSFTIGVVGPWGNGKSSLIELMERQIEEEPLHQTLHLKFLPYLNHNESEIISEFFAQLSGAISHYNGELADFILDYSDRLLKLYKNKNIKEFFASRVTKEYSENTSIETYRKINRVLEKLNKRFIVFIDDLDRLSSKEVLQVLKLVRNTANFRNFIFVIALDKDYVLNTLVSKNDISDHTFVDKFFQLEVYLPEIDKLQLKQDFITQLKKSGLQGETEFIKAVEKSIYQANNLFDDYISNHRGAKRLVNQLVFDYQMLPDELDTNDFLNFTYLKMSFPYAIKFLNSNWQTILPYNPETRLRQLEEFEQDDGDSNQDILRIVRNARIFSGTSQFNPDLEKYKITSAIDKNETLLETNQLSNRQNELLGKTLIALFGKENENPQHTSIKFGSNLRKLLHQKTVADDLTNSQFQNILNEENNFESLKNAISAGKTDEVLDRIIFYSTEREIEINNIVKSLLFIFNKAEIIGVHSIQVLQILSEIIKGLSIQKEEDNDSKLWTLIDNEFLSKDFSSFKKLEFLAFLSENRIRMGFTEWGIKEEDLKKLSLKIFKTFLADRNNVLWDMTDYSFYHAYRKVCRFHSAAKINPLVIDFWKENDIRLLCAQMIQNEVWTIKMLKTSDHAATVFGSKQRYLKFVLDRIGEVEDKGLKEYQKFVELESYRNFSSFIRFEFVHFEEIKQKLKTVKVNNRLSRDEYSNVVEIYMQSFNKDIFEATFTNVTVNNFDNLLNNQYYESDGLHITVIMITSDNVHNTIPNLLKHYKNTVRQSEDYVLDIEAQQISKNGEIVLEVLSVQPEDYTSN